MHWQRLATPLPCLRHRIHGRFARPNHSVSQVRRCRHRRHLPTRRPALSQLRSWRICCKFGLRLYLMRHECRTSRFTERRPRYGSWQFGSHGGAAIGELIVRPLIIPTGDVASSRLAISQPAQSRRPIGHASVAPRPAHRNDAAIGWAGIKRVGGRASPALPMTGANPVRSPR